MEIFERSKKGRTIGDLLPQQLRGTDADKEENFRNIKKTVGQAHQKAINEYGKLMTA